MKVKHWISNIGTAVLSLSFLALTFNTNAQALDTEKSIVTFEIGNMIINTVEGSFKGMKGSVNFNAQQLATSKFEVCIDAATVDTDNEKRDAHLKNADFFDVEKYPTICFKSNAITQTDKGYVTTGDLTMHGITKKVEIPFTYQDKVLEGTLTVKRLDYKVGVETGTSMVSDEVVLKIKAVLQ